jgi:hypothetical protein
VSCVTSRRAPSLFLLRDHLEICGNEDFAPGLDSDDDRLTLGPGGMPVVPKLLSHDTIWMCLVNLLSDRLPF